MAGAIHSLLLGLINNLVFLFWQNFLGLGRCGQRSYNERAFPTLGRSMPISLPPELEAFAYRQIEAGRYESIEDLLVDAVRALSVREEDIYQGRFEELRAEVQVGIDALQRGESQDLDTAMDNLRQKMQQKYGA